MTLRTEHQPLIEAIPAEVLLSELNHDRFLRFTNKGDNELYIVNYQNSPNVLREIGRLRELTFRAAGGGTGLDCDLDELDLAEVGGFEQLLVWSPEDRAIIGAYRFIKCSTALRDEHGHFDLATAHMFKYSEAFERDFLPYTIELGRAFVQPAYQPGQSRRGIFSLDNIWDGLGAIVVENPEIKYLMGKVTMFRDFNIDCRDLVLYFLEKYCPDPDKLMVPYEPVVISPHIILHGESLFEGETFKDAFKKLVQQVRAWGENVPPLMNIYMNLSDTMRSFGTSPNMSFGDVDEAGILVTLADIVPEKKERHLGTHTPRKK